MITHRQIEAFRALMLTRSFTAAAQVLGVTQSAVSKIVAELENEIGFPLRARQRGGFSPTPEALALHKEVEQSFESLARLQRTALRIRDGQHGSLRVGTIPALATGLVQRVVSEFCRDFKSVPLSLEIHNTFEIINLVAGGFCDVGFAVPPVFSPGVSVLKIINTPCVAVLPPEHHLTSLEMLNLSDFKGEQFISLGENTTTRLRIDAAFMAANIARVINIETRWSASICWFVARGHGLSIIDPYTALAMKDTGFVIRPLAETIEFSFAVLAPRHKVMSALAEKFLNMMLDQIMDTNESAMKKS